MSEINEFEQKGDVTKEEIGVHPSENPTPSQEDTTNHLETKEENNGKVGNEQEKQEPKVNNNTPKYDEWLCMVGQGKVQKIKCLREGVIMHDEMAKSLNALVNTKETQQAKLYYKQGE